VIVVIAGATFREAVRSRSFLSLLAIYAAGVLLSRVVGWISATDGDVITSNIVFSLQSVIGVLVAVATGTALVHSEIRQRTLYTVLTRPLPRWHFVVGKFAGLCCALLLGQAAMLLIGLGYLVATGAEINGWMLLAGLLTAEEVCLMAAVGLCLTALSSPLLAAVLSLAIYALGHAVHSLPGLLHHLDGWRQLLAMVLASFVPDLGMFRYRERVVYGEPPHLPHFTEGGGFLLGDVGALPYGLLWITLLVLITVIVLRNKQL